MLRAHRRALSTLGLLLLASAPAAAQATIQAPPPGSALSGAVETFSWSAARGAHQYWLRVGSSRDGGDIYNQSVGTSLSATVSGLPTDGRTVYVRLSALHHRHWRRSYATYTASTSVPEPNPTPTPTPTPPPPPGVGTRYFPATRPGTRTSRPHRSTPSRPRHRVSRAASAGARARMQIDFSIEVLRRRASTRRS